MRAAPFSGGAPQYDGQSYSQGHAPSAFPGSGMPVGYGSAPGAKPWSVPEGFGDARGEAPEAKGSFSRHLRRRMNVVPIALCLLAPWLLFSAVFLVTSLPVHYEQPGLYMCVTWGSLLAVLASACGAISIKFRLGGNTDREPSWFIFLTMTLFLAWTLAWMFAGSNYESNTHPYLDMMNLNNYSSISPAQMRGQQLMDAGSITFAAGTKLDLSKSMGFKNTDTYCVAPITIGDVPLGTYDFWAVGMNCCSGNLANFHCEGFNDPRANGGLRLMNDGARAYYRLAVQQAEAAYNIRAVHPLFFQWMPDPMKTVESWRQAAWNQCLAWIFTHFLLQAFLVAVAAVTFSKLGHL